jgi:hypothetical protein
VKFKTIRRTLLAVLFAGTMSYGAAQAATAYQVTVPGGVSFQFQSAPSWVAVPEAQGVYVVRDDLRPSTDYFRYQNSYYVYSGGTWYRANTWNGRYVLVSDTSVPRAFYSVKQTRWRAYPPGWQKKMNNKK